MVRPLIEEHLVFKHGRWEIAHLATNSVTGILQWERRDTSYICNHSDEDGFASLPAKPPRKTKS